MKTDFRIDTLVKSYADWLHEHSSLRKVDSWQEVTVPFLDHTGDHFQFYARFKDGALHFDDDGYTLNGLQTSGFNFKGKRAERLTQTARQFGATCENGSIIMKARPEKSGDAMNRYVQALIHIDSLVEVVSRKTTSYFVDDVAEALTQQGIFYTQDINIQGKSLYSHNFNFLFQKSRTLPTTFAQAPSQLDERTMATTTFAWIDVSETHERRGAVLIVFTDDREKAINQTAVTGFAKYGIKVLGFSQIASNARQLIPA